MPPGDIDRYRVAFDALIAPYRRRVYAAGGDRWDTARWMSPLKIFEYMASGVPMLASDLPTIREVLTHDANALLCDPDDIGEWCRALERVRDDRELAARLAANARTEFDERYTWHQRARAVLAGIGLPEPATPGPG